MNAYRQNQNIQAMKTALRVLAAVREQREPANRDIEALRDLSTQCSNDIEDLANEILSWALVRCAAMRVH